MARHTFVTVSHITGDETRTVDILTRADVKNIVAEVIGLEIGDIDSKMEAQERKLAKMSVQTASAAKIAAEARKQIEKIVETARETFQGVIEELLAPHYRLLEQHLGIELPAKLTGVVSKKRIASTRKTDSVTLSSDDSVSAKPKKKTTRRIIRDTGEDRKDSPYRPKRKTASAAKTQAASKKKTAVSRTVRKVGKLCR